MASTYTTNLGIEKITSGEQTGTWGDTTNVNFDVLDEAINGVIAINLPIIGTSGAPNDIPISEGGSSTGRNAFIEFTDGGDLGGTAFVRITPNDAEKIVYIRNSLTAARSINLFQGTYNASNDFTIPNGADVCLKFNGGGAGATVTDVFVNLTVTGATIPNLSGSNTGDEVAATISVAGIVERATQAEVDAGSDVSRYVTPETLGAYTGGGLTLDSTPKTALFTAVASTKYYIDTSGGTFTMTLPITPSTGDQVAFVDYGQTFATNNLTVGRNGEDIMNIAQDMAADITNFSGVLEYSGATRGWILV